MSSRLRSLLLKEIISAELFDKFESNARRTSGQ
jgi:hypothetical protein